MFRKLAGLFLLSLITLSCTAGEAPRYVQLLLGHSKIESTVRYLGIEVRGAGYDEGTILLQRCVLLSIVLSPTGNSR